MSDLYFDALDKYAEIKIYFDSLNERFNLLYGQAIDMGPKCNDRAIKEQLDSINREIVEVKREMAVISYLLEQIKDITFQFFREYHYKKNNETAETNFIEFLNSSTYKAVMSGSSLALKNA